LFVRVSVPCLLVLGLSVKMAQAQAVCDQQARFTRPIQLGISGGNIKSFQRVKRQFVCFGGTLGSMVEDTAGQYILSNNHVLGRTNKAKRGEGVVQPGLIDSECKKLLGNRVATFSRDVKLTFNRTAENTVDAAIAQVAAGVVDPEIRNIGAISSTVSGAPLGLDVQKMGRTTCLTTGTITAVAVNATVSYDDFNPAVKRANFVNQIMISSGFSDAGDSGSLVVTQDPCPRAVGLLFARASDGSSTLVNPISNVLSGLGVTMVGSCGAATVTPVGSTDSPNIGIAKEAVTSAAAVRAKHNVELMKIPGAVGTGIGIGDHPGQPAIEVYVSKITPEAQAAAPSSLDGLTVRLVETHGFVAY
jgi:hypothetical protein